MIRASFFQKRMTYVAARIHHCRPILASCQVDIIILIHSVYAWLLLAGVGWGLVRHQTRPNMM